jgi:monoamine oxidase
MPRNHVIVAGAGLAGLSAARELETRGLRLTVIDARDRVGGRVWTIRDGFAGGQHAEAGADIIESDQTAVIALAKDLGLPLVRILKDGFGFYTVNARGRSQVRTGMSHLGELFAPFYGAVREYQLIEGRWDGPIAEAFGRESVAAYLVRTGVSRELIDRMRALRGFFLADPEDLSMLAMLDFLATGFGGEGGMFRVKGGNDQLATKLAATLKSRVRLGTVLRRVEHGADGVITAVEDRKGLGRIEADALILAMPATTVREVAFDRPLPDAQWQAIASLKYGGATRLLLQYASRWWVTPGRPRAFGSDLATGAVWDGNEQQRGRAGILSLLAGGRASAELVDIINRDGADGVTARLRALGRPSPLLAAEVVRWNDDPWVGGGYAFFDTEFPASGRDLLARPHGRLFFAGEHTSIRWQGYMNGAVDSGVRAATEVAHLGTAARRHRGTVAPT